MGPNTETHSQTLQRERDVETPRHKWDIFIKSLPLWLKELYKRGGGKCVSATRDGTKQAGFSKHINSKKLRQLAHGLHGYGLVGDLKMKGEIGTCLLTIPRNNLQLMTTHNVPVIN